MAAKPQSQAAGPPNQTLFVKNLNDKINKNELKRALYMLFSSYGPVLDVVTTRKSDKAKQMRGQAHVVFRDIQTSTQAMRSLQGFGFLGKEMNIAYAKGQSQIIAKLSGTFEAPTTAAVNSEATDLQKSIFNAPPSSMPLKSTANGVSTPEPHGLKRAREDEEDSDQEDAPMEEDDDDAPMEEDDDDD